MKDFNTRRRIVILILCYVFFLTSRWTMKGILANRDYRSTEIGVPFELSDDITVTVLGWNWAEEQGLMEVELEIINVREDLNRGLAIESGYRENTDTSRMKPLESETVLEEGIYRVLWIKIAPDLSFSEVVLRITDPDGNLLRLYTNRDIITRVDSIEKLTAQEYLRRRYAAALEDLEDRIADCETAIAEKQTLIDNLEQINEELLSAHYTTIEELERSETLAEENRAKQDTYAKEIEELMRQIDVLEKQAEELREKLEGPSDTD